MSAPDPFALGGRQGDAELIAAEQRLAAVRMQREECPVGDARRGPLSDEIWDVLHPFISRTLPQSLAGAAVKLRLLTHPEIGIDAADMSNDDWISLQQVRDFIEGWVAAGPLAGYEYHRRPD